MMEKISVIVPIYNAADYLVRCLDSLLTQTIPIYDIILVNDGSTDGSKVIVDEYAKKHKNIRVIHQKNQGVSAARNAGLDLVTGEYILFVDSDDYLLDNRVSTFTSLLDLQKYDYIITGYYLDIGGQLTEVSADKIKGAYNPKDVALNFDAFLSHISSPCTGLYRKNAIGALRFDPNIIQGEDVIFNMHFLRQCTKIKVIDISSYVYAKNTQSNSITSTYYAKDANTVIAYLDAIYGFLSMYLEEEELSNIIHPLVVNSVLNDLRCIATRCVTKKESIILMKKYWKQVQEIHFSYLKYYPTKASDDANMTFHEKFLKRISFNIVEPNGFAYIMFL